MRYILLVLISGLIGWFTNYIAVLMLFKPRKPIKILFFTLHGIFPKRQALIAEKIGKMVSSELLSVTDIQEKMSSPGTTNKISQKIETKIDQYLNVVFPSKYPVMSIFIGNGMRTKIKNEVMQEVKQMAPQVIHEMVSDIGQSLNIEETIKEKVKLLSSEKLEKILNDILKNEFTFIEWIGGILGLMIGLIQVLILILFP